MLKKKKSTSSTQIGEGLGFERTPSQWAFVSFGQDGCLLIAFPVHRKRSVTQLYNVSCELHNSRLLFLLLMNF